MCLVFQAREATRDVDALFEPKAIVREAAADVAAQEHLPASWLNDAVKVFLGTRAAFDPTLVPFLANLVFIALMTFVLISAAGLVGIPVTSFVAVIGAAGLAVALAFQGTLSNFSSGVMLLTFRPFKVGDFVEAGGVAGTIQEIGIFVTTIHTPDNVRIIVPNSTISFGRRIDAVGR